MKSLRKLAGIGAAGAAAVSAVAYGCYRMAFYSAPRVLSDGIPMPEGEIYDPYREQMAAWVKEIREMPHENMEITAFDGLKLRGKYYEYAPGAPVELMLHGYRGSSEQDMSGGVFRAAQCGHSALIIDHRGAGRSEGNTISFGINERKDCLRWIDLLIQRLGPDTKIIVTGISMGAATAMMIAGEDLPENVIGVLADCGYSSPREIILKAIREMGLPPKLSYPFVKLGAKLYGGFDLEESSPEEALKRAKVPVIFFHGDRDDLVPCEMSWVNYEACASRKKLVITPGAGHGLCFPMDQEGYIAAVREFFAPEEGK